MARGLIFIHRFLGILVQRKIQSVELVLDMEPDFETTKNLVALKE